MVPEGKKKGGREKEMEEQHQNFPPRKSGKNAVSHCTLSDVYTTLSRRRNGKKIIWIGHEKKLDEKQGGLYLKRGIFGLK